MSCAKKNEEEKETEEDTEAVTEEDAFRINVLSRVIFLFITQSVLVLFILFEAIKNNDEDQSWGDFPNSAWIVMARFICGVMMHISLSDELEAGMGKMKYSANHPWKFDDWKMAFLAGLLQTFSVIFIEIVNIVVILTSNIILDIVMNFMALVVIWDFGEFCYVAFNTKKEWKDVITSDTYADMLRIQTTTS